MTKRDLRIHELKTAATAAFQLAEGATRRGQDKEAFGYRCQGHEYEAQAKRIEEAENTAR